MKKEIYVTGEPSMMADKYIKIFDELIHDAVDEHGRVNYMSLKNIDDFFNKLGNIYDSLFEIKLTKIVEYYIEERIDITNKLETLLYNSEVKNKLDLKTKFAIFFLLFTYNRRMKNISQMDKLLKDFKNEFSSIPLYIHLKIMYNKNTGLNHLILEAMEQAYFLISDKRVSNHTGILHNFAETVVEALERGLKVPSEYIKKSEEVLKKIINILDYPKYHATYARLLAIKRDYSRARLEITRAIDLEDPKKKDYALRINEYMRHLIRIEFMHQLDKAANQINNEINTKINEFSELLSKELEAERTRYIEMLGLFATLISIALVGVFSVISSPHPISIIIISLSLAGILLTVLSGFHILIYSSRETIKRAISPTIIGIILVVLAVIIWVILWK